MRLGAGIAALLALAVAGLSLPAWAGDVWHTTVRPEPAAARDPAWSAIVQQYRQASLATAALPRRQAPATTPMGHRLEGLASFYWQDQSTASGERFDRRQLTAAHPTLPFNSLVRVMNPANGRSVIVRINDRGPYKPGRIIDLAEAAADQIGMRQSGIARVKLEVLGLSRLASGM